MSDPDRKTIEALTRAEMALEDLLAVFDRRAAIADLDEHERQAVERARAIVAAATNWTFTAPRGE